MTGEPSSFEFRAVWDFLETVRFARMRPCPERVGGGHCLGEPGGEYLVYIDDPRPVEVRLEAGATYGVEWIDGRDTSVRVPAGDAGGDARLEPPPGGDD